MRGTDGRYRSLFPLFVQMGCGMRYVSGGLVYLGGEVEGMGSASVAWWELRLVVEG